jgi:hypothetical protein
MKNSTFNAREIENFLSNIELNFVSVCWYNDMVEGKESNEVGYDQVVAWFNRFFPPHKAQFLFRVMECECAQSVKL